MCRRRCKGSRGYIIFDKIGRSILGEYQFFINVQEECKGSRGYIICDRIFGAYLVDIIVQEECKGSRGYIICDRMPETEDV